MFVTKGRSQSACFSALKDEYDGNLADDVKITWRALMKEEVVISDGHYALYAAPFPLIAKAAKNFWLPQRQRQYVTVFSNEPST